MHARVPFNLTCHQEALLSKGHPDYAKMTLWELCLDRDILFVRILASCDSI